MLIYSLSKTKHAKLVREKTLFLFFFFLPTIAVIGAGIGGTSAAYYLRQKFGKDVKIHVFEKGKVGGRLATLNVQGQEFESGGSIIHPLNLHMKRFVKDLGM